MSRSTAQQLRDRLDRLSRSSSLLVACDYDGTLAPIVAHPDQTRPNRESLIALRELASLPGTHVAVISGRSLRELASLLGEPERVHLVGSHGSEFDPDFAGSLPDHAVRLRDQVRAQLLQIVAATPGAEIEEKPASIALHYRNARRPHVQRALEAVSGGPALIEGVFTRHGKMVVELAVVSTNKGRALETIRHRVGAAAALFLGDDVTDEDAFATLCGPDVGIKVGPGRSKAGYRVRDSTAVAQVLARLWEHRSAWVAGPAAMPIEHHAMLSDQRTAALVTSEARIVWLCLPRLDSPAIFAELLGGPSAGYFSIAAADGSHPIRQRYAGPSMVLQTQWSSFRVTDFLDCSGGKNVQRPGRTDLIRILEGSGRVLVEFAPRLDFGRAETRLEARDNGLTIKDVHDPIVVRSPGVHWSISDDGPHQVARAEITLEAAPVALALCHGTGSLRESATPPVDRLRLTERYWSSWASRLMIPPVESKLVQRSALVLKALCFGPTGAIAAAVTTSLPEHLGGVRNWDYRYCWLRDAAMAGAALVRLGSDAEAMHYLDWLLGVLTQCEPERLQPLYTLTGQPLGPEAEITELSGYAGSRPVRLGNAASRQVQLDVFGPIVDLIALLIERDAPLTAEHWRLVNAMVQAVARRWREPDHGIWELRRTPRHHVHSKVMCWVTVDRAARIAERYFDRPREDWLALRGEIAADILARGFKPSVNAFTSSYDADDIDAAALAVGLSGLLPPDDPRFRSTVDAVERELRQGPTVYRYRYDDGLPGAEGGFNLCTAWLIEAYLLGGRIDDAWSLFHQYVQLAGPTGVMAEEYEPRLKRALGNVPQAYSHIGLIDTALQLARIGARNVQSA